MRRILASLLVVLVGFSLIPAAAFASNAESKVPACCRRDGKHHCSLAAGAAGSESNSGLSLRAARCPSFPTAKAVPAHQSAGLPGISRVTFAGFVSQFLFSARTETRSQISFSQAGQKRGPPALLS